MRNEPSDGAKAWAAAQPVSLGSDKLEFFARRVVAQAYDAGAATERERDAKIEAAARELANLSTTHYTMHGIANCRCCMSMNNGIAALLALLEKP